MYYYTTMGKVTVKHLPRGLETPRTFPGQNEQNIPLI